MFVAVTSVCICMWLSYIHNVGCCTVQCLVFLLPSSQCYLNIAAGCCMAIGFRYAGTGNKAAYTCLVSYRVHDHGEPHGSHF